MSDSDLGSERSAAVVVGDRLRKVRETATRIDDQFESRRVQTETSAQAVVDRAATDQCRCVVARHTTDGLDGIQLLEDVRRVSPQLPFVLVTPDGHEELASEAVAADVTGYVPVSAADPEYDELAESVERAVSGSPVTTEAAAGPGGDWDRTQQTLYDLVTDDAVADGDFDTAVERITETAADRLAVDRVNVWLFDDERTLRCVDNFDRQRAAHDSGSELLATRYPSYFDALRANRILAAEDVDADPRTEELEAYFEEHDVGALLDATLRAEGEVIGVVCHEHVGGTREWRPDEQEFANDVADVVHRALRNRESSDRRAELEFRKSLLTAQQESIPGGILVVGEGGEIVSSNERLRDLWNLPRDALAVGTGGDDVLAWMRDCVMNPTEFRTHVESPLDPGETERETLHLSDGRLFDCYTTPVVGEDDHYYGRLWLFRDVTDRRKRQQELELKDRVIAEAPIGITVTDPEQGDNPIVFANEQFTSLTGYSRRDVLGRNCRFLQGAGTDPDAVAELRSAIDDARPTAVELRNYREDGTEFWNRVRVAPVTDGEGTVTNYVGFQSDVTERKSREQELRRNERRFEAIFEDPNILVALLDTDGTVRDVNQTAVAHIDADREAVLGTPFWETPWFTGDDALQAKMRGLIERAATGAYADFEIDHTPAVDHELVAAGELRPVTDDDGDVQSLVVATRDITERRRRERQLDAFERVLRHNLRNELNVVLGNAEVVTETTTNSTVAEYAANISESSERLLDLAEKQRQIVSLLSNAPDSETQNIAGIARKCARQIQRQYPDAAVGVTGPDAAAARTIPQFDRAVTELLENAIIHSDGAGDVTGKITTADESVCLRVRDNCPEIPADERAILRGDGERDALYHGSGMGLWLVNWIVTYSGGRVRCSYDANRGNVVSVTLPRPSD